VTIALLVASQIQVNKGSTEFFTLNYLQLSFDFSRSTNKMGCIMIIESSQVTISSEHQKNTYRTFSTTSTLNLDASKTAQNAVNNGHVNSQFNQLITEFRIQLDNDADSQDSIGSNFQLNEKGLKSRGLREHQSTQDKAFMASMNLFQRLLQALAIQGNDQFNASLAANDHSLGKNCSHSTPPKNRADQSSGIFVEMTLNTAETIEEHESLAFNSTGIIATADGKNIAFALNMSMERHYSYTSTTQTTHIIQFKDPLIINFPGSSVELSNHKYLFDIDADGKKDMISYITNGAMLALDKNNDGVINDGTELFGPLSGNGFADLANYDEDGNNFIDAADSIFKELKLWTKTKDIDSLINLASQGIGAIYLGATDTPFALKGVDNQHNGQVKASSFYLTETGKTGYIQQVDMVV